MTYKRKELGGTGEELAAQFLLKKGFRLLDRNLKTRYGEIDLLAADGTTLVVVEVKTKTSLAFGQPYEMVHATKQKKLRLLATEVSLARKIEDVRIDVVSVDLTDPEQPKIEHIVAAC